MRQFGQFWRKLIFLLRRDRMERELQEEMRLHAQLKTEANITRGMDPVEARYAAQRQLGNATLQREESRQSWGFPLLESVIQDLRYGLRGLRKSPGFTTVAMLTLALGIGATTAIFSIVHAVLLRPLPYRDSPRIVELSTVSAMFPEFQLGQSIPNVDDIKASAHSLEMIALFQLKRFNLTGQGEPELISAAGISSNFLELFGIQPILGRRLLPEDEQLKNGKVVLLSYSLWQRRFGGDAGVVGKSITLDQESYTVAGVLPAGFNRVPVLGYKDKTEAWVPLAIAPKDRSNRTSWMYLALAKLRPGVSVESAQQELDAIASGLARQYPKEASNIHFPVVPIREAVVGNGRRELLILVCAVGFLLLIACTNVSNLVLSRGLQRRRELAVRVALGASRSRIVRQLFLETMLLASAGGALGLGLAAACVTVFRSFAPADFPRLEEVRFELQIALFAFVFSVVAALLCGLAPALSASRSDLNATIQEKSPSAASPSPRSPLRSFLVVTEVALALVLLAGSALMIQSMVRMLRVDPGLRTDHMVTARVTLSATRYASPEAQALFTKRLFDALRAQPAFSGVAMSNNSMLDHSMSLLTFDPAVLGSNEKKTNLEARSASPGFFTTMGIAILRGRDFSDHDVNGAPQVVIINDSLSRRFFPGQDPVGKMIKFSPESKEQYQIIGVAADTRDIHLSSAPRPEIYFPILQDAYTEIHVVVRSTLDAPAVTRLLENCLWSVDKDEPLRRVRTMTEVISGSVAEPRFRTWLLSAFATAGLTLTLIGIYGVISYSVMQRTHEMGVRIALGAQPENVLRLVLAQGLRLALLGSAIGLAGSVLLMRLLESQLYEVKPGDPATMAGAAVLMLVVAFCGSYVPARRATKVDPMIALRYE